MRIDATDPKHPGDKKYLFPCDCGNSEYLEIAWYEDDPPYLWVTNAIWSPGPWGRIKASLAVLFGRKAYQNGVILDPETGPEVVETINQAMNRKAETNESSNGS